MNGTLGNFVYVCREIWKSIGLAQRVSIILVALGTLGAIGVVMYMGTRPNWQVLYSKLDAETASKIYEKVKDQGVPVKLRDSGKTILVPYENINDLRLMVADAGIQVDKKGVGLELFDNVKLGLTEMQQNVGLQRAIQGELERMIGELPGIDSARVMLVMPRRRVFRKNDQSNAKANVFLVIRQGATVTPQQVASIRHMVANSAEELSPEDVSVSDSNGRLLARGTGTDMLAGSGAAPQLEVKQMIEDGLREKAEAVLRPIVGFDNVIAMVSVDVDFNAVERTKEVYDAENAVVVSERTVSEEDSKTNAKRAGGPAGTGSNMVSVAAPEGSSGSGDQRSRKTVENEYLVPKTTERTTQAGPRVRALSVAVTIGKRAEGEARTKEELEALKELVRSAVGAVTDERIGRIDLVTVIEGEFVPAMDPEVQQASMGGFSRFLGPVANGQIIRPVVGLLMLCFLYYIFGSTFRKDHVESVDLGESEYGEAQVYAIGANGEAVPMGGHALGQAEIEEEEQEINVNLERLKITAAEDPSLVAGALEAWLSDEG